MMPKNKIGRHMMAKLKLCIGPNHPHQAQCPIPLEPLSGRPVPAGALLIAAPAAKKNGAEESHHAASEPDAAASSPESSEA